MGKGKKDVSNENQNGRKKKETMFRITMRRLIKNKMAVLGMIVLAVAVLIAIFGPLIAPYDYAEPDIINAYAGPSLAHPFGTDDLGRDIFSRIVYGARTSLIIGIGSVVIAAFAGVNIGIFAGWFGKALDAVYMRLMDAVIAFPATLLAVVIIAITGTGTFSAMLAIAIVNIPAFARLARSSMLAEKGKLYVDAERAIGAGVFKILYAEILPNISSTIFVQITVSIANAILLESALSFLGLGTPPPSPSWGAMLSTGKNFVLYSPTYVVFPGLILTILIIGLYLFGDALRDYLDPRSRNKR